MHASRDRHAKDPPYAIFLLHLLRFNPFRSAPPPLLKRTRETSSSYGQPVFKGLLIGSPPPTSKGVVADGHGIGERIKEPQNQLSG
jgi:hypothetical protein